MVACPACLCQFLSDANLLLSTSLQLANMKWREGPGPQPNLGTLNIPLDPCQDSQAAARWVSASLPPSPCFHPVLTLGGPLKPLPPQLAQKLDKEDNYTPTSL